MPNFVWMCSLCRFPVVKSHNFGQILAFLGLLYRPPFTDEGQIRYARADPRSTMSCQISSECGHCVRWPKMTILGKFWIFEGSCTDPFYRWGPSLVCQSRPEVYAYVPNFFLDRFILSPSGGKKQFCHSLPYFGLRHLVVWPIDSSLRKLNTGAQLQTFPCLLYTSDAADE